MTVFTFSLALLSLGGLPPLAGFMSKWQISPPVSDPQPVY
ncbi:MAG: hypothetical protein H6667_07015 [Ardenticatenaceae bacterium]|nr:hypothetical protein [Ardenticatenaceae bacterium]